jgi:osmoprotectant transport system permease protein
MSYHSPVADKDLAASQRSQRLRIVRVVLRCFLALAFLSFPRYEARARESTVEVTVGSKGFTESVILGDVLAHVARAQGAKAIHRDQLGGSQVLWKALESGEIDAYVDYTGTIREFLSELLPDETMLHSEADIRDALAKRNIVMTDRLGFNNTYALGMRESVAARLNMTKISDLKDHPNLKLGLSDEFMERRDGWLMLPHKYRLPKMDVRTMDHNLAYRGLENDAIQLTDLYSTDAEIKSYNLRVLEDDLAFFPKYYAVILMRADLQQRAPKVFDAFRKLENAIETDAMMAMNASVRLDRELESNAAAHFLNETLGFSIPLQGLDAASAWKRMGARLARTTAQHLYLVAVSLIVSILVGIPLGIVSVRYERIGHTILAVVGVIQTLPSMALLVFMIPFLGLGALPAIAALFFYSLLPIVRNTYTGIQQIPTATMESAQVLGLDGNARLKLIELPLAMPSILAGIKTAAVINVGTATIGSLIGAGGYGEPILAGLRLASIPLILQGAIPAALMAIAVQFAFGYLEKRLVSPGLLRPS